MMHLMLYRFYQSGNGTAIPATTIDARMDDSILRVIFDVAITVPTDAEQFYAELSWISTIQRAVQDVNGVLCSIVGGIEAGAAGTVVTSLHHEIVFDKPVRWEGGERLYLHTWTTATTVMTTYASVFTGSDPTKPATRRRGS